VEVEACADAALIRQKRALAPRDLNSLATSIALKEGFSGDGPVVPYLNNIRSIETI
jgi:hypothetical protein